LLRLRYRIGRDASHDRRQPAKRGRRDRADVPGGSVRRTLRRDARNQNHQVKGGITMAKKAAKGAKKKAAKKR
jgi:hypothetical protein